MLRKLSGVILIVFLLMPSVTAQENTSNLLEMLATVPDTPTNRENPIVFVDIRAMERARPIETPPKSLEEYESLNGTFEGDKYWTLILGIRSLTYNPLGHWQDFVGFDWFDVDRVIEYGETSQEVTTLVGEFDVDEIAITLSSRDYSLEPNVDFMLWCGTVGCENGLQISEENIVKHAPFGGDLGREQPISISNDTIISAPLLTNLNESNDTINGIHDTLATDPAYQAAINAIDPESILIQASFFDPSVFVVTDKVRELGFPEDQIAIFNEADLPPYELVFVADTVITGVQVVYIVIVYDDDENIDQVADIVANRLQTMRSLAWRTPFYLGLESRGILSISPITQIDESTGKSQVMLRILSPSLSSLEVASGEVDRLSSTSALYSFFYSIIVRNNDTLWIASEIAD